VPDATRRLFDIDTPHDVEVLRETRVFDDFLKVDEAILRVDNREQRRLALERGDAAAALVHRADDGKLLFTRQFRYPTLAKGPGWILEVAAGIVEDGETPAGSIRRELEEELGYGADHLEPIASFYASPGGSTERIHLFYAEVSEAGRVGPGGGREDEAEAIEVVALDVEELAAMLERQELHDAKTVIAAMWFVNVRPRS
jgi:ADP-ribose pyrophosphatase